MSYGHGSILVNGRGAALSEILSGSVPPQSAFERETFEFIIRWLKGDQTFTLNTSGSTGTPKEITVTRSQLIHSARRTIRALGLSADNTALVCLDTKYIAGKMMLVRALEANMKIVAVEPSSDPVNGLPVQPDFGAFVPLQLDAMLKDEKSVNRLNQFKVIILGGASVSTALMEKIRGLSCAVYATYGMTETVSHIALQKLNGADARDYFETLPGIKIHTDARDCLVIELPDFREPIITHDIVQLISNTGFKILGRYDNVINSGGVKLVPETLEKKIELLLANRAFFIAGVNDDRLGQKLVLIVEGKPLQQLPASLRSALSTYEVPKEIFYLDEFVRTETQKINRVKTIEKALKSSL